MNSQLNIPSSKLPRVIIVGGGFGGIELAKQLKNKPFQVVLLDKHNYHAFQPLLYQVATAGLESYSIATPYRALFERQENFVFRMTEVLEVLPSEQTIKTTIGNLKYDYLVIATGSITNFFGMQDVKQYAMSMKSIPQALDIRSMLIQNFEKAVSLQHKSDEQESLIDIVIVGGGPTGIETAGALAELRNHVLPTDYPEIDFKMMDIYLVELGPRLLAGMSEEASSKTKQFLEELGVNVWLNTGLVSYDGYKAVFNNGKTILTTSLIYTAGVAGVVPTGLNKESIGRGNRLSVDQKLRVKGYSNIFSIGDVAAFIPAGKQVPLPMVAPVAIQMGTYLAKHLVNGAKDQAPDFVYQDKGSMATIGKHKAVVDLKHWKTQGAMAWFIWMFVHLMSLVGFGSKVFVFLRWAQAYMTSDKKHRLIIRPFRKPESEQ